MPHRNAPILFVLLAVFLFAFGCADDDAPRVVAIGDLHGDLDATRRAFRLAGAVDDHDRWVGGDLTVVQTGDLVDRGDDDLAVLEYVLRLKDEARAAGGTLHVLNANHEVFNVAWRFRYVTEKGFADFADVPVPADVALDTVRSERRGRAAAFMPGGPWAVRLADHPVVLQLGDNLFAHGGVLPSHVDYGVERWNEEVRAWFLGEGDAPEGLHDYRSPTWTRIYSDHPKPFAADSLAVVLEALGAARLIVGHTVQEGGVTPYFDERVWCIDTGMSAHYGGEVEVLEIVGDRVRVLRED